MTTQVQQPLTLDRMELDTWLASGWYRIGQTLMTTGFLLFRGEVRSAIWTRSKLEGHQFGRNARKLIARNDRLFSLRHGPAVPDAQHEALYARYRGEVVGDRPPTLTDFLNSGEPVDLFDTREIGVWEGERLVAFGWYDLGHRSLQSLIGVYDPDHRRESLGLYTLLCEVRHARELALDYHYSGYVVPGDPSMDYKLRAGGVEFRDDRTGEWRPWAEFDRSEAPFERMSGRLQALSRRLADRGVQARVEPHRGFDLSTHHPALAACLDREVVLLVRAMEPGLALLVTWREPHYRLDLGNRAQVRFTHVDRPEEPPRTLDVWVVTRSVAAGLTEDQVMAAICARTR